MKKVFAMGLSAAVLSIGALAVNPENAQAASISYSADLFTNANTPTSGTAEFLKFNSALGTLTGVTISSTLSGTATLQTFNMTGTDQSFTNGSASFLVGLSSSLGGSSSKQASSGIVDGIANVGTSSFSGNAVSTTISLTNLNIANYIGDGTSTFTATGNAGVGSYSGSATAGVFFGGLASLSSKATVTYTYDVASTAAVPEPLTILGAATAVGFGVVFKRHASKNNKED